MRTRATSMRRLSRASNGTSPHSARIRSSQSIKGDDTNAELVAKLSEYGEIFVDSAVVALANVYRTSWIALGDASDVLALGVVRVALSYLTAPPADAARFSRKTRATVRAVCRGRTKRPDWRVKPGVILPTGG